MLKYTKEFNNKWGLKVIKAIGATLQANLLKEMKLFCPMLFKKMEKIISNRFSL